MPNSPLVSVCTPVYNGGQFLEQAIRGVLRQTFTDFEYIIVDNNSTDNTPDIIEKFRQQDSRIKVIRNEETVPVIDNFLICIKHAITDTKWIKYALADDYLFPNCIEEMLKLGQSDSEIGFVSAYRLYGNRWANGGLPVEESIFNGADVLKLQVTRKLHVCTGSPNTVMYRRSAYEQVGGFDRQYLHADTELAFRLLDRFKLGFVHYFLTRTGLHGNRQEVRSIKEGLILKEYLDFGFEKLDQYQLLHLSGQEKVDLAEFYANALLEFYAIKLAIFDYKSIKEMNEIVPEEVKEQYWKVLGKKNLRYLKPYFITQLKFARAILRSQMS